MSGGGAGGPSSPRRGATRPLRIVVPALWYYPDRPSGSSRLAYDEARYLAAQGHDVWLVGMGEGRGQAEASLDGRLHVLRYRRPPWAAFDPFAHARAVRQLLRRYIGPHVDLVHAHMLLPGAAAFQFFAGRARTCYSLHSPVRAELTETARRAAPHEAFRLRFAALVRSRLERRLLQVADTVTCDSEYARRLAVRLHGDQVAARLRVASGWVDLSRFRILEDRVGAQRALGWPTDRPVLFCLRRLVPRMGLDTLLRAAARLKAGGQAFHLVVGGEGDLRGKLLALSEELGLADVVRFAGRVSDEIVPLMYGAADAFVLPTAALECFGLTALEALACGRPVLATPVGAIPEVLGGVEPAWLARDASAEALASLLGAFLQGRLPAREPPVLRTYVEARYAASRRIPDLAALALGMAPDRAPEAA